MKLKIAAGELALPHDFSFTMQETNPFFSDEGDASIPANIPVWRENLKKLDNIQRIDSSRVKMNKIPATLQSGAYVKNGQLIIDSVSVHDGGISASMAIANSDLYSQHKEKSLRDIFALKSEHYLNVRSCIRYLNRVMSGDQSGDYALFPVAVAKYEDEKGNVVFQYNNEINLDSQANHSTLVWEARTVRENDVEMEVPVGYGVSPFLYLHRMSRLLFELLGYTVEYNCFEREELRDIVLINNNSDSIVDGNIDYKDLVPSCTLSDFLQFLNDKFCCQVRVDSSAGKVWIMLMRDMLRENTFDIDLTKKILGNVTVRLHDSSRVVLSSQTTLDDTSPAAETFDKLMQKYKYFHPINEGQYRSLWSAIPSFYDCLVQRKSTGEFYELRRDLVSGEMKTHRIGTNFFTYDRQNSDESERHASQDELCEAWNKDNNWDPFDYPKYYLYIGDRLHAKTTYNSESSPDEQKIILAWANRIQYKSATYGSQQKYDNLGVYPIHDFSLTPQDMYEYFWSDYNNILLNHRVELSAEMLLSQKEISEYSMVTPKLINGQKVIPTQLQYEVGRKTKASSGSFLLAKNFKNSVADAPIVNNPENNRLKWQIKKSAIDAMAARLYSQLSGKGIYVKKDDGTFYVPDPWPENPLNTFYQNYTTLLLPNGNYHVEIIPAGDATYIGPPTFAGQVAMEYIMKFKLVVNYDVYCLNFATGSWQVPSTSQRNVTYEDESYKGQIWFVSVPY